MDVRKIVVQVEETLAERDRPVENASRKVVAAAVVRNPLAGTFTGDLSELEVLGAEVAALLAERALARSAPTCRGERVRQGCDRRTRRGARARGGDPAPALRRTGARRGRRRRGDHPVHEEGRAAPARR